MGREKTATPRGGGSRRGGRRFMDESGAGVTFFWCFLRKEYDARHLFDLRLVAMAELIDFHSTARNTTSDIKSYILFSFK